MTAVSNPSEPGLRSEEPRFAGEHARLWSELRHLPTNVDPDESGKLHELAGLHGSTILELGCDAGFTTALLVRSALTNGLEPQCYFVSDQASLILRTWSALRALDLDEHVLGYHGELACFHREVPISPTLVVIHGGRHRDALWADLNALNAFIAPGTPLLCLDAANAAGLIDTRSFEFVGRSGRAAWWVATPRARGLRQRLTTNVFREVQNGLWCRYHGHDGKGLVARHRPTPTRDVTAPARADRGRSHLHLGVSGRGGWPYQPPQTQPLPPTLPNGRAWPKISIVTATYNQGKFIEETILSIRNQGYPNIEHIVIDGGSTDDTPAILDRYRDGFAYAVSEKDRGQSHAINKGMAKATGDIMTWLNSDDMLAPGALAAVAMAFYTSKADMVAGICQIQRDGDILDQHLTCCANGALPLPDLLNVEQCWQAGQFFYQPEVFFRRSLWEKAGGRVEESMYWSMDYELWLRFAAAGAHIHVIGRPTAIFRIQPDQKTASDQFVNELKQVRDTFLAQHREVVKPACVAPATRSRLKIAMLNDLGFVHGAGIAHGRMAEFLAKAGHDVSAIALRELGDPTTESVIQALEAIQPDLVIVGNLHGAGADAGLAGAISSRWKTMSVLHDFWMLTGRCPYPGACTKYLEGCDHTCPTADQYPSLAPEKIRGAWTTKQRVLSSECPPVLLANSKWTMDTARRLYYRDRPIGELPANDPAICQFKLGFPTDLFRPRDKSLCRDLLGLPQDKFIVFTSSCSMKDERKGLKHLVAALDKLRLPDVLVVFAGHLEPGHETVLPNAKALGFIREPERLAMVYSAADLFVGPSLDETFGQIFVEAAACGTPSIAYPSGGAQDAVCERVTGTLTARIDTDDLAWAIEELYADPERRHHLGAWARIHAENEWSYAAAYHRFFNALRELGLQEKFGLSRKISLRMKTPVVECGYVSDESMGWIAVDGFGIWEGPLPQIKLPRFRWAFAPAAKFEVPVDKAGPRRLVIRCVNWEPDQTVRFAHNGRYVEEVCLPIAADESLAMPLEFRVDFQPGRNVFELLPSRWTKSADDYRRRAFVVLDMMLLPVRK